MASRESRPFGVASIKFWPPPRHCRRFERGSDDLCIKLCRRVTYLDGKVLKQQQAVFPHSLSIPETKKLISYLGTYCDLGFGGGAGANPEVSNVKMDAYSKWLKQNDELDIGYQ